MKTIHSIFFMGIISMTSVFSGSSWGSTETDIAAQGQTALEAMTYESSITADWKQQNLRYLQQQITSSAEAAIAVAHEPTQPCNENQVQNAPRFSDNMPH